MLNYLSSIESGGSVTPCSQLVSPPPPSPTHAHTHTHTHTQNEPARSVCGGWHTSCEQGVTEDPYPLVSEAKEAKIKPKPAETGTQKRGYRFSNQEHAPLSKKPPTLERSFSERRKPIRDENCPSIYTRWRPDTFKTTFWTCFTASLKMKTSPIHSIFGRLEQILEIGSMYRKWMHQGGKIEIL